MCVSDSIYSYPKTHEVLVPTHERAIAFMEVLTQSVDKATIRKDRENWKVSWEETQTFSYPSLTTTTWGAGGGGGSGTYTAY